jgi:hypothetical protein
MKKSELKKLIKECLIEEGAVSPEKSALWDEGRAIQMKYALAHEEFDRYNNLAHEDWISGKDSDNNEKKDKAFKERNDAYEEYKAWKKKMFDYDGSNIGHDVDEEYRRRR